jgi:hypothetical protein
MMKNKKPETLVAKGLQASLSDDPDWVRTSDPHPVKVNNLCRLIIFNTENP